MILLSDVPSAEEAGDSAACCRSLADLSLTLTSIPLPYPVDLRVWASDLSHGRTRSIWSRISAAEARSRDLVNGFWRISVDVLVEGVCAPTHTSLLQERAQTDLQIAAAATQLQG